MKLILLKDHELGKANDVVDVTPEMGNYLVRCKVGVELPSASPGVNSVKANNIPEFSKMVEAEAKKKKAKRK